MLKLLSLFSGIGAFEKALENIGEPFEIVRYCEIDKYASKAYSLIHNLDENMNLKDVITVQTDELPNDIDFITYGFPCQDISVAGKKKGFTDENGDLTRSGLFFEALRIIEDLQPKIAIAENVKALTGKRFKAEFKIVLDSLNDAGYRNYWAVLNAKDYGIPQNRERVFIVSIRDDIDHGFTFPEKYELKLRLKDLLEDQVDEKYFLNDIQIKNICINDINALMYDKSMIGFEGKAREYNDISPSLTAREYKEPRLINETARVNQIGNDDPVIQKVEIPQIVNVRKYEVDKDKLVKILRHQKKACGWTNRELAEELEVPLTKVEHWFRTDDSFAIPDAEIWSDLKWLLEMDDINEFDESIMTFEEREGTYEKAERCYHENGISPTITAASGNEKVIIKPVVRFTDKYVQWDRSGKGYNSQQDRAYYHDGIAPALSNSNASGDKSQVLLGDLRIRKLTPKECFRLMGFDDKDCDVLVENKISNTQIYKMAGNSIVVDVLEELFVELLNQYDDLFPMCEELQ